jgi:hypothetical protein
MRTLTTRSMPNISSSGVTVNGCVDRRIVSSWQFPLPRVWSDVYPNIYWRYCRVNIPAFEGLELLAGKLARAVLRGLGAGDSPRLLGLRHEVA